MIKVLLILLVTAVLQGYELQKEYTYNDPTILSTDLFPDIAQQFEIVRIPDEKTLYRLDAQVISKTFELHGIALKTGSVRYVTFTKKSPIDFTLIKGQLAGMLRERYPSIRIDDIIITPRGYLASLPSSARGVFNERYYLENAGTFYVLDTEGLRHYLDYRVVGSLGVLHTTQKVTRNEILSGANTIRKTVPFQSFRDIPLTAFPDHPLRYRSTIRPGTLLTQRNIEEMPLVLKNDTVVAVMRNGTVELEMIVTATQEGSLYDIITIQKRDGKRSKAKVIGEKRVELQ